MKKHYLNGVVLGFLLTASVGAPSALAQDEDSEATAEQSNIVEINGVAGYIEVRTSPNAPLSVRVTPGRKLSAISDLDDGTLTLNGRIGSDARATCTLVGPPTARIEQTTIKGTVYAPADLPRILITGPDTLTLNINGSVLRGNVGNIGGASIQQNGCGLLTIGNISGDLEINVNGAGKTRFGRVSGTTDINIAGSGDVEIATTGQKIDLNIQGSGNIAMLAGRSALSVNIAGSGSVRHGGVVINPEVNIAGSGNVTVARVEGRSNVSKQGSGVFRVN
jgi:hypothetical protein